ncbi:hypothetical protein RRG08_011698 [Elysia crispata]|uniref:Fibrinogen C-terminal domain-containing protein n=1 Tax=Elysia crispata TaxID=231223 RepID=A0AAE1E832_9GAST|nr:hypothetical protein RRG08_011698 [Elysia crispata]
MINKILLWAFACVLLSCQGLELTLDRTPVGSSRSRTACGLLQCVEQSHTNSNENVTVVDHDIESTAQSDRVVEIFSLKVFKVKSTPYTAKRRSLLASISPEHSRLNRVSNGMKVDGRLETGRAVLKIKLNKETDCQAEFLCQVHGMDAEGRQVVRTSHITQLQPIKNDYQGDDPNRDSGLTLQVLTVVQELNAKLAVMDSTIGGLGQEMNRLRETVEHDTESLRNDLDSKTDRLENKNDANNKRLEDKLGNLERNVDSKTERLEDKIESMKQRLEDSINSVVKNANREETTELSTCQNNLSDEFRREIASGLSQIEEMTLAIKNDLAEIGTAIDNSVDDNFLKIQQQLQAEVKTNETTVVDKISSETTCEKIKDMTDEVIEGFASLSNSLQDKFSDLSSSVKSSATDVRRILSGQVTHGTLNSGRDLQYTLANLLTPKTCYRGMSAYVPSISNKYIVIGPSLKNGVKIPVLCDMRTDGGGWVVIQRRVIGDVDFYKGWDAYKNGFGSLYGDFWIGNDIIHNLTNSGKFELRIDMKYNAKSGFAHYGGFSIADESGKYAIKVSSFDGTAGDSLTNPHNGSPFTTYDRDNDAWSKNCAVAYTGAWWYKACHHSNLNGVWGAGGNKGPRWNSLTSTNAVTFSEMKIRQLDGKTI